MDELESLFKNYTKEAFRLELLPEYRSPEESEDFELFKKTGKVIQDKQSSEYLSEIAEKIQRGVTHKRARVLEQPITNYQLFEIETGYKPQHALGVKFYFIAKSDFEKLITNEFDIEFTIRDFWFFDNNSLVIFNYNDKGEWEGYEIITDKEIFEKYRRLKDLLISGIYTYNLEELKNRLKNI